jgi:hypothetical protein
VSPRHVFPTPQPPRRPEGSPRSRGSRCRGEWRSSSPPGMRSPRSWTSLPHQAQSEEAARPSTGRDATIGPVLDLEDHRVPGPMRRPPAARVPMRTDPCWGCTRARRACRSMIIEVAPGRASAPRARGPRAAFAPSARPAGRVVDAASGAPRNALFALRLSIWSRGSGRGDPAATGRIASRYRRTGRQADHSSGLFVKRVEARAAGYAPPLAPRRRHSRPIRGPRATLPAVGRACTAGGGRVTGAPLEARVVWRPDPAVTPTWMPRAPRT